MKAPRLVVFFLVVAAVLAALPRAARAEISFSFFVESLEPHGDWIEVDGYGYCWQPDDVGDDWAPYTDGYWTYTDAGWTWVSYEDWGGLVYHYGRWVKIEDEGWCWVPDYEWGPAWVSWRHSDDHIGWAPLPPEVRFRREVGISVWVDSYADIGPGYYNFCHVRDFGAPVIREVCLPRARNVVIIQNTVNITNITFNTHRDVIYCGGPRYDFVAARSARPVPALKLVQNTNINVFNNTTIINDNAGRRGRALPVAVQRGNALEVFAPKAVAPAEPREARPAKIARVVSKEKVNKGWAVVKDEETRKELRRKLNAETKGLTPETAPAKPVQVSELKAVPEKADVNAPSPVSTAGTKVDRKKKDAPAQPAVAGEPVEKEDRGQQRKGREPAAPAAMDKPGQPEPVATTTPEKQDKSDREKREKMQPGDATVADKPSPQDTQGAGRGKDRRSSDAVAPPQPVPAEPATADAMKKADEIAKPDADKTSTREQRQAAERVRKGEQSGSDVPVADRRKAAEQMRNEAAAAERERAQAQQTEAQRAAAQAAAAQREKLQADQMNKERAKAAAEQAQQDRAARQRANEGEAQQKAAEAQRNAAAAAAAKQEQMQSQALERQRQQQMERANQDTMRKQQADQAAREAARQRQAEQAAEQAARKQQAEAAAQSRRMQELNEARRAQQEAAQAQRAQEKAAREQMERSAAVDQRRQQQAAAAAAERRQQMEAQRQQQAATAAAASERRQQMEAQREAQAQRASQQRAVEGQLRAAQQRQVERQVERQPVQGGEPRGKGKRGEEEKKDQ